MIQLKTEDIIVGVKLPPDITSKDRSQKILSDSVFRKSHGIKGIDFHRMPKSNNANCEELYLNKGHTGALYLRNGQIQDTGSEDELLSSKPIVVDYTDGGLEYLKGFVRQGTDKPSYECRLQVPNTNLELIFYHPVKDMDLVARITK